MSRKEKRISMEDFQRLKQAEIKKFRPGESSSSNLSPGIDFLQSSSRNPTLLTSETNQTKTLAKSRGGKPNYTSKPRTVAVLDKSQNVDSTVDFSSLQPSSSKRSDLDETHRAVQTISGHNLLKSHTSFKSKQKSQNIEIDKSTFQTLEIDESQTKNDFENLKIAETNLAASCDSCHQNFTTLKQFFKHFTIHEETNVSNYLALKCFNCGVIHKSVTDFKNHLKLKNKKFQCSLSDRLFKDCSHLIRILITTNSGIGSDTLKPANSKKILCNLCVQYFPSKHELQVHINKFSVFLGTMPCILCPLSFKNRLEMFYHLIQKHYLCITCVKQFSSEKELHLHYEFHNAGKILAWKCSECGVKVMDETELHSHGCEPPEQKSNEMSQMEIRKFMFDQDLIKIKQIQCMYCNLKCTDIKAHVQAQHNIYECVNCDNFFRKIGSIVSHCSKCIEGKQESCKKSKASNFETLPVKSTLVKWNSEMPKIIDKTKYIPHCDTLNLKHLPCILCNLVIENSIQLVLHTQNDHFVCFACFARFKTHSDLVTHEEHHLSNLIFVHRCLFCGDNFHCFNDYKIHVNAKHPLVSFARNRNSKKLVSILKYSAAPDVKSGIAYYQCPYCLMFMTPNLIETHLKDCHNIWRCKHCSHFIVVQNSAEEVCNNCKNTNLCTLSENVQIIKDFQDRCVCEECNQEAANPQPAKRGANKKIQNSKLPSATVLS